MKRWVMAAVLLAAACTPPATKQAPPQPGAPVADGAGNRMETLAQNQNRWCTGDGAWCAVFLDDATVGVEHNDQSAATIPINALQEDGDEWRLWPQIVRVGRDDDAVLFGVVRRTSQMYSGGGGSAEHLTLFEGTQDGRAQAVLTDAPLSGSLMTRACFNEEDEAARRGACHDEYDFVGTLALDESVTEGAPRLALTTEATTAPGRRSRASDSTQEPPLTEEGLAPWRDETCSYRRVASRQGDAYVWDQPLPACSDYLEP